MFRWLRWGRRKSVRTIQEREKAPDFRLPNIAGGDVSLAEALDKGPVIVAFFKVSCPVCQFTFPFLERMHRMYGSSGAAFLAISQDDADATREFCAEYGVTFAALVDDERGYAVSNVYGLTNVPSIFFIAPGGDVKFSSIGFDRSKLESMWSALASSQAPAQRSSQPASPPGLQRAATGLFRPGEVVPDFKPG